MSTSLNSAALAADTAVAPPPPRFDFPTWLPPMLVKELRQGLRTRGFIGSMIGFQVVLVIAFVWAFAADLFGESDALQTVNGFFWGVLGVMLLVITPLRALAGLRQEIEAKSLDLLMLTNLTAWRIVLGKWTSLLAQAGLLLVALLPYAVVRYFFGSVDLLADMIGIGSMYLGCGVLTALALWMSAMPKLVRIGLPIVLVMGSQGMVGLAFGGRGLFYAMGSGADWVVMLLVFELALLLVFCLVQAVKRIAPPSDNHSPMVRGLALLTVLPAVVMHIAAPAKSGAEFFMWLSVVALTLVTVIEIWNQYLPMGVHVRRWWKRGRRGALAGRLVLPGWPSAAAFAAGWIGLAAVGAGLEWFSLSSASPSQMIWLLVLLWTALVFPMVLLSFMRTLGRAAPFVYFIVQAIIGILSTIAISVTPDRLMPSLLDTTLRPLMQILPGTSFWLQAAALSERPSPDWGFFAMQAVMVAGVVALTVCRARPYWRWVAEQAAVTRKETGTAE